MKGINKSILLLCTSLLIFLSGNALDGSWRGDLNLGFTKLPLVFNFTQSEGKTNCTLDSPNQNAFGLPTTVDYESTDSIAISAKSLGASFTGHIANNEIKGVFSQRGHSFPLTLIGELPLLERRPQTPQPPFPYQEIDTVFCSSDGTRLAGTIILPDVKGKIQSPLCVFVTGSGPQNRDEEIFEHKPFAVIADFLGRNGIASFRYDERGTAKSQGDYASATIDTFKNDAKAAVLFAKGLTNGPVGIIGHSEGGTNALLLAEEGIPDFIVSLAGMAISGKETLLAQNKSALEKLGLDKNVLDDSMTLLNAVFDEIICQTTSKKTEPIDVDALVTQLSVSVPEPIIQSLKNKNTSANGYFGSLLATDARKGMDKIFCPVLALNGTLDTQVNSALNLEAIRDGVKAAVIVEMPGLNHLFQHAKTGEVNEYSQITETISPEVMTIILDFIQSLN